MKTEPLHPAVEAKTIFFRSEFEIDGKLFLLTLKLDETCRKARLADLSSGNRTIAVNNYPGEASVGPQEALVRAINDMTQLLAAYLSGDGQ